MLQEQALRPWLALLRAPGVGARTFVRLTQVCGTPQEILALPAVRLRQLGVKPALVEALLHPDWDGVARDLEWLAHPGRHCLTLDDSRYPTLLKEIADPPPLLFVLGDCAALAGPQLAMVGSRNPSPGGRDLAHAFARELAQRGLSVTSGLAMGIDAAAHRGALAGGGVTLAVAGTGLDQVYPSRHRELQDEILNAGGAVVSEFPVGVTPMAANFPRRNRIISGLSLGTLVVEAALRSGSLITARMALEQNREVFAIPGSIQSPLARGCNALIREGAKLVETVADILEELGLPPAPETPNSIRDNVDLGIDAEQLEVLKCVAYDPTSVDTLVAATGKTPEIVSSLLLMLELQGRVISLSGGYYSRT